LVVEQHSPRHFAALALAVLFLMLLFSLRLHAQAGSSQLIELTITPETNVTYNEAVSASVFARDATTLQPLTGTVNYTVDGGAPISATINSQGLAYADLGRLSVGNHTVTATFPGNEQDSGSTTSATVQVTDAPLLFVGTQGTTLFVDGFLGNVQGVAVDAQDNLYVADESGNVVMKEDTFGSVTTIPLTGIKNPVGLALDSSGNLYIADTGNNRILKFDTSGSQTTVPVTGLSGPTYLAYDRYYDQLYIVDPGNNRIVRFTPASGTSGDAVTGMTALRSVAVDAVGNLFFSDRNAGFMEVNGLGQTPIFAGILEPGGITASVGNYLILSDAATNTVIRYDNYYQPTNLGHQIQINNGGNPVVGMASDSTGRVYLALGGRVDVLNPGSGRASDVPAGTTQNAGNAVFSLIFQTPQGGSSFAIDPGPASTFNLLGSAKYCQGDAGGCAVDLEFTPQVAGVNTGSFSVYQPNDAGNDVADVLLWGKGIGGAAAFSPGLLSQTSSGAGTIGGVALDAAGNRYVTDSKNNAVYELTPSGASTTLPFTGLSAPTQVAVDKLGAVYVLDSENNRIERLSKDGLQSDYFVAATNVDGFSSISAFTLDGDSNLVVAGQGAGSHTNAVRGGKPDLKAQDSGTQYAIDLLPHYYPADKLLTDITVPFENSHVVTTALPAITGVAIDAEQNIYSVDATGSLWRFGADGSSKQLATGLASPIGVAVDPSNTVYVLGANPKPVTLVYPDGSQSSIPVNGLYTPAAFAFDAHGDILLGDDGDKQLLYLDRTQQNYVFGDVNVGQSSTLDGSISNLGNQPFTLSGPLPGDADFSQTSASNACAAPVGSTSGTTIAPTEFCDLGYTFTPPSAGPFTLSGTLATNPATLVGSSGGGAINLSGTGEGQGAGPQPVLTPSTIDFGSVTVGATSTVKTATLSNTGGVPQSISSFGFFGNNPSSFSETNNCGSSLAAGASCSISITCTPSAAGSLTADLGANFPSPTPQQYIALTCTGTTVATPQAALSPASLSFTTTVGTAAATQAATLTNKGTAALALTSIAIGGTNPTSFAQTNTCGSSLAAGSSCTVTVSFTGTSTGSYSATLTATDNASPTTQTVQLTGLVTTGSAAAPAATLTPSALNFGSIETGTKSTAQNATLTNTGNAPLTIASVSLTGANSAAFTTTNACASTLAAGASCTISVTFNPASAGTDVATLSVSDNAPGSPQTSSLAGVATALPPAADFSIVATPASQSVASGSSATYQVTIASVSGAFTQQVALAASGLPAGATASFAPASVTPGSAGSTSTLTIQTGAQQASASGDRTRWALPVGLVSAALLIVPFRRRRRMLFSLGCLALLLGLSGALTACGGGFAVPQANATPATYTVTVTGTSGSLQHSTSVQITVR
jgi:sugar lactone lactonase YvrE